MHQSVMEVNGLRAAINTPPARKEYTPGLPPYCPQPAYHVDDYPACPKDWMHGSGLAKSYFVPVEEGRGMWFDFTANRSHQYHVAVVTSVQGINPIDGEPISELKLLQYREECPRHKIQFGPDRFCEKCGYKWPAQNYLATTTNLMLWIDGFRTKDGEIRQYVLTSDITRGVAAQKIGDKRVYAIGFAFYLSKEPRPVSGSFGFQAKCCSYDYLYGADLGAEIGDGPHSGELSDGAVPPVSSMHIESPTGVLCNCSQPKHTSRRSGERKYLRSVRFSRSVKKLEIAAGAKIDQDVGIDLSQIDFWQDKPTAMIYVNYVTKEQADEIIKAGKSEPAIVGDGPLAGLKVGN